MPLIEVRTVKITEKGQIAIPKDIRKLTDVLKDENIHYIYTAKKVKLFEKVPSISLVYQNRERMGI